MSKWWDRYDLALAMSLVRFIDEWGEQTIMGYVVWPPVMLNTYHANKAARARIATLRG